MSEYKITAAELADEFEAWGYIDISSRWHKEEENFQFELIIKALRAYKEPIEPINPGTTERNPDERLGTV